MSDVKPMFFCSDIQDRETMIDSILIQNNNVFTREELEIKDDKWLKDRVRRYVVDKEVIHVRLTEVYRKYERIEGLFKPNMKNKHASILEQLANDYLTDPDGESLYFNAAGDETLPKYVTARGTSQLESLHYRIPDIGWTEML